MFTELKWKTKITGNLAPKPLSPRPTPSLPSREKLGDLELRVEPSSIQGVWHSAHKVMTARRSGQWFQNGAPTALGNVGRLPKYKPSPGELNRMVGNQGCSEGIPRPESSSTTLLPVYRSRSSNSNYQRESRRLRNMSIHDITWKS